MELVPQVGFGDIRLGMLRSEVKRFLGRPDKQSENDPELPGDSYIWVYQNLGTELAFDRDVEYRLARITVRNPDAVLLERMPIGMAESKLRAAYPGVHLDWSGEGLKDYVDDMIDVSLMVEEGRVVSITLSPEYDQAGEHAIWPQAR